MTHTTQIAIGLSFVSLLIGCGGIALVQHARGMPAREEQRPRAVPGTVLEVLTARCPNLRRPGTCFRSVVGYSDGGQRLQVASRALYRQARHEKGESAEVLLQPDGTAWIASEWDERQAARQAELASARRFPMLMGILLAGCGGLGLLLGAAIASLRGPAAPGFRPRSTRR